MLDSACVCMREEPANGTCTDAADSEKVYYEFTTSELVQDFDMELSQPENTSKQLISLSFHQYIMDVHYVP